MDIDFRWGGDPNIVLGVEAALVASIPIQVGMTTIWMASRKSPFVWEQLCLLVSLPLQFYSYSLSTGALIVSVFVVLSATVEGSSSFYCCSRNLPTF